ncbi:helix-turn-helix domain-containing protein [Flavilitoribacter nigricans]|uniref:AraC family transcriptional regulator n=1 Tax=Flavilitoribacter nigricans (strain ATCC 23147 / DSM 23189 / NBRC 102662 / NCIMB 1420 / SS-2) TaxID=1122177 RepID=A0A2D0N5H2_FLAN2|nr:helix-turn-helix transcriptional regulator [Flavilitoribacter nigricans]PHN03409.1 AraC family transcriptional regulator [Flavilitoribacter nigricans DSM 23189 = NBRC 102662]
MEKWLKVDSIAQLVELSGFPPVAYPYFAIIRVEDLATLPGEFFQPLVFNFYTAGLKKNLSGAVRYGRATYDFNKGVLGFTAPNQVLEINEDMKNNGSGWMIFFEIEFLRGHALQNNIDQYGFFNYDVNEALHLSDKEEKIIEDIFQRMAAEYENNIDRFSREVMLSYLDLLLKYSNRYYSRQFITRNEVGSDLLKRFEQQLGQYFREGLFRKLGLPTVAYFAEALCVSPNYLSDFLRSNTGKSTQEHIHLAILEQAKILLLSSSRTVSQIAYELGFEYPQYFSRLFKQKTGLTPSAFRMRE